jgi:hypothetical protein
VIVPLEVQPKETAEGTFSTGAGGVGSVTLSEERVELIAVLAAARGTAEVTVPVKAASSGACDGERCGAILGQPFFDLGVDDRRALVP